jgi:hypothetical protein
MRTLRRRQHKYGGRGELSALSLACERRVQLACPDIGAMFSISAVPRGRPAFDPEILKRAEHVVLVQPLARAGRLFEIGTLDELRDG